jgi:putative ABC transport system permease protein
MNLGIRAILYTTRKWKKTLLIFCLLLSITTLVLSGLAIADAQEEQSEELRGVTGASFTVTANNGYTLNPVTDEMIDEIAAIDGIESYNASQWTIVNLFENDNAIEVLEGQEYTKDLFYGTGCFDSAYSPLFLTGALRLTEGHHVTEGNGGIILYEGVAEKYGLSIGDTLEVKNGNPDDPLVECEIAGLFEVIADDTDEQATMAKPSTFYDYEEYIFVDMDVMSAMSAPYTASEGNGISSVDFFVSDAAKLESIVQEVQENTSIDWNSYYLTVNDEVYERISSSLSDTGTLVTTLIVIITVVSVVLIILILSMSVRSRKREMGILLAVGIAKPSVILQYVLETALIAVVAFPLAYLSSSKVAGTLGTLFGKAAENVVVTPQHFALVAVVGSILLIIAVIVSCIPALRFKPKQILSQME